MTPGEIFMAPPASDEHILRQAEIGALRQMSDTLNRMGEALQKHGENLGDVRERMIRLEERNTQVERLREELNTQRETCTGLAERINGLEAERDRRAGASGMVEWLSRNAPMLLAFAAAAAALSGVKLPHA